MTYMVGVSDCAFSTSHHRSGDNVVMGQGVCGRSFGVYIAFGGK